MLPTGGRVWLYRYRANGKNKRYRIGDATSTTPTAARRAVKGIAGKLAGGEVPNAAKARLRGAVKEAKESTLGAFLTSRYGARVTVERKTGKDSVARIASNCATLMNAPMDETTAWELELWRKTKHEKGRPPATTNRDLTALRARLSKAVEWKVINKHPLADLKPRRTDKSAPIRVISDAEENALMDALSARDARLIERQLLR